MKVWSILVCACLFSCDIPMENYAESKFATNANKKSASNATKKSASYYHAQYRFTHANYDDVDVAVRIAHNAGVLSSLQAKDLTPPATAPVENITLNASGGAFVGSSSGSVGGQYTVKLTSGACCGEITFVPASDLSATFVGMKSKDLTTAEWDALTQQASVPPAVPSVPTVPPDALLPLPEHNTKQVGEIFRVNIMNDGNSDANVILQAHLLKQKMGRWSKGEDFDDRWVLGEKIDQALARWSAVGENIFNMSVAQTNDMATFDVFLTFKTRLYALLGGHRPGRLVAYVARVPQGEFSIKAEHENFWVDVHCPEDPRLNFYRDIVLQYRTSAWGDGSIMKKDVEVMITLADGTVVDGGAFTVERDKNLYVYGEMSFYKATLHRKSTNDRRPLECTVGQTAFVREVGKNMVYMSTPFRPPIKIRR